MTSLHPLHVDGTTCMLHGAWQCPRRGPTAVPPTQLREAEAELARNLRAQRGGWPVALRVVAFVKSKCSLARCLDRARSHLTRCYSVHFLH